jgi:hypothetical protein
MTDFIQMFNYTLYWVIHNFLRVHFTTKEVPAVSLGLIENGLVPEELFSIQCM